MIWIALLLLFNIILKKKVTGILKHDYNIHSTHPLQIIT